MQDAGKFPPQKPNQNGEAAQDTPRGKQEREAADKPALKVTFERPETRDALKLSEKYAAQVALVPEPAPANSYRSDAAGASAKETKSQDVKAGGTMPLLTKPESSDMVARSTPAAAREVPSAVQLLTTPLLAIVAALSLLAAGWSYAKLRETSVQLTSVTEALATATSEKAVAVKALAAASAEKASTAQAKVSAEKALADAQVRLATVEKTVADIKAALAAIVTTAATDSKPAITTPAK